MFLQERFTHFSSLADETALNRWALWASDVPAGTHLQLATSQILKLIFASQMFLQEHLTRFAHDSLPCTAFIRCI
jgi:hypothetical protein